VNVLPAGWFNRKISDVVHASIKRADPKTFQRPTFKYVEIGTLNIVNGVIADAGELSVDDAPSRARQVLQEDDCIFSTVRPYMQKIGRIPRQLDGEIASTGFCVLRPNKEIIDARYLSLFASSGSLLEQVLPLQRGVSYPSVSDKDILNCWIAFPPIDEQHRIVELLEDHLSRLDAAETELRQAERKLKLLRSSSLEAMIPIGVAKFSLGELATESRYGTSTKCTDLNEGTSVVRIPNLIDGRIDLLDEKRASSSVDLSSLMLNEGDVLFVRTNGSKDLIGRTAVVQQGIEASFASYLIKFTFDKSKVRPEWVHNSLGGPTHRERIQQLAASSAGQFNLGLKKLDSLEISVPSLEIQDKILTDLDQMLSLESSAKSSISATMLHLKSLRRSVLNAAFTGQLTNKVPHV